MAICSVACGLAAGALERYRHVTPPARKLDVNAVAFRGCTMEWTVTELAYGATKVTRCTAERGEIDLSYNRLRLAPDGGSACWRRSRPRRRRAGRKRQVSEARGRG